jgi:hypothetical protein
MKQPLEFHSLANIFPMMTDEEVNDLGDDMLEHGQRQPIWLFEGMILDGRNRYNACLLKDIEPHTVEFRGADPVSFVTSANLHRRHLEAGQRAMIAAELATMKRGDNQHSPAGGTSQAKAAEVLNVGKRSVERAAEVIERGTPELVDAVKHGDVKLAAAAEFAKQAAPDEQAKQIAKAGSPAAAVKAASALRRSPADIAKADRAEQTAAAKIGPADCAEDDVDRAEAKMPKPARGFRRLVGRRGRLSGLKTMLEAFSNLSSGTGPRQVAEAVRQQGDIDIGRTTSGLRRVAAFATDTANCIEAVDDASGQEVVTAAGESAS